MRPITWAFDAAVVLGVLLGSVAVTSAAPSASERALNGTTIIDQVAREADAAAAAVVSSSATTTATTITASPGKSVMSSQSSVKSSISPSLKRPSEFEPLAENARFGASGRTSVAELKFPPESANDEENMVMSEQDARRLKPNQKKTEQQQHQRNVEKVIDEAQFDFEHYFDSIPSSFGKDSEESSKSDATLDRESSQQLQLPVFEATDPSVLQKILEFLGLEDFLVDQHLREADKAVNETVQRDVKNDDDVFIVKSVKVNVRKV